MTLYDQVTPMAAGVEQSSLGASGQQQGRQNWWQKCTKGTRELWSEVKAINRQPMYLANNWGFVPVQAALGVFTFWGPKASTSHHKMHSCSAGLIFSLQFRTFGCQSSMQTCIDQCSYPFMGICTSA